MIIDLPKTNDNILVINDHMIIENGILKLKFPYSLRNAMYSLTYQMKGKHRCSYCSKEILNNKVTLDHVFPQDFGGPTITNNLEPCCVICNQQKSNLTKEQFQEYILLPQDARRAFLKNIRSNLDTVRKENYSILPTGWVQEIEIENIFVNFSLSEDYRGTKYKKTQEYYEKYGQFQKTIILDRKNFLLDGFIILMYCKNHNIQKVPVIILENVDVIF